MHGPFSPRLSCASSMADDEDGDFLESVESLKQSSASLDLHESGSCLLLLPCGLLPEELAELEGGAVALAVHVEAAVCSKTLFAASEEPLSPHTPAGMDPPVLLGPVPAVAGAHGAPLARGSAPLGRRCGAARAAVPGERAKDVAGVNGIEPALADRQPDTLLVEPAVAS